MHKSWSKLGVGVGRSQHSEAVGVPNVRLEDFGVSQEADELTDDQSIGGVVHVSFLKSWFLSDVNPECPKCSLNRSSPN